MKINLQEKRRTFSLTVFICIWIVWIAGNLFRIQVVQYNRYLTRIKAQSSRLLDLHAKRGTIYDRNGEILAISVKAQSAFLKNKDPQVTLNVLQSLCRRIDLPESQKNAIKKRIQNEEKFIWLKRKLSDVEYARLQADASVSDGSDVLSFLAEYKRIYPQQHIACHVLGGVGIDEQGLSGSEYGRDSEIAGKGGRLKVLVDARQKIFQVKYLEEPQAGKDIYLTIDTAMQFFIERALADTVKQFSAKGGCVIVMDSKSGAILALASAPEYDPNEYGATPIATLRNKATSYLYDPGSTFKVVLASAALENHLFNVNDVINCGGGKMQIRDRVISDTNGFQSLSFGDVIVKSSNVGAAHIGLRLGSDRYYHAIKQFGFGERTGSGLPLEENGILHAPKDWSDVSLAFMSHGYEISVTPLQMIRAFNVIASGGYLLRPSIYRAVDNLALSTADRVRILSPATVAHMRTIMNDVVERGTGDKAKLAGLAICGKTGTAKKVKNGHYTDSYAASFGGFFPASDPALTMFIVIDEPQTLHYGGQVAAPLFRTIAEKLIVNMHILPALTGPDEITL